ncbi:MAG: hypothetical protein M3Y65_24810 [Pseudomonadota bacterium]|nr:hypothetical protein [Pseudomonadota bacterium]
MTTHKKTAAAPAPTGVERFTARTILLHLLTGKDGESLDLGRVMWIITAFAHIGYTAWQAASMRVFDPMAFATGAGLIAGGFGANILMKAKTEPDAK